MMSTEKFCINCLHHKETVNGKGDYAHMCIRKHGKPDLVTGIQPKLDDTCKSQRYSTDDNACGEAGKFYHYLDLSGSGWRD